MRIRRKFSSEFKARVVLEVLSGAKSHAEACREYGLKDGLLSVWKRTFVDRAAAVFQSTEQQDQEKVRVARLERLVGRQALEIDVLKKASAVLGLPRNGDGS